MVTVNADHGDIAPRILLALMGVLFEVSVVVRTFADLNLEVGDRIAGVPGHFDLYLCSRRDWA